jgi:hypothetical protein
MDSRLRGSDGLAACAAGAFRCSTGDLLRTHFHPCLVYSLHAHQHSGRSIPAEQDLWMSSGVASMIDQETIVTITRTRRWP